MSGHSKWAQIKRQKGATDAKRGQLFTKLGREIAVAARESNDPDANSRLRLAIQRARDANMPMENIERAIKRGSGGAEGANYQEIVYEGYGPNGVAILVSTMTDNRNRATAEIRNVFNRQGGSLAEAGAVRWLFDPKGVISVKTDGKDPDEVALMAIDAGADDVQIDADVLEVYTDSLRIEPVRNGLEAQGVEIESSEAGMVPKSTVQLDARGAEQTMRLIERLEELDDVQQVFTNSEVSDDTAAALAS